MMRFKQTKYEGLANRCRQFYDKLLTYDGPYEEKEQVEK
jgi:hypothetical protein